jgi:hypothetical protein
MRQGNGMKGSWAGVCVVALAAAGWPQQARADVDLVVFAGTSRGLDADRSGGFGPGACVGCAASQGPIVSDPDARVRQASFALALVGTEGRIRGGGEVTTHLGVGDSAAGFTGVVTYAGADSGHVFAHVGLGAGSYWGDDRLGRFSSLAGTARGELGVRLSRRWLVAARGDLLVNSRATTPVLSFGLQFVPGSL